MSTAKREINTAASAGRRCCVITLTWLTICWIHPAFPADAIAPEAPSATPLTAQSKDDPTADSQPAEAVTYLGTAAAPVAAAPVNKPASSLRFAPISTLLNGDIGYDIEQRSTGADNPTLQQRLMLNLHGKARSFISQPWIAKVVGDLDLSASKIRTNDNSWQYNSLTGKAGLYLLPYSRFPFEALFTRNQNNTGPGLGSKIFQTNRFDLNQRFTPKDKKERYQLGYYLSETEALGPELFRQNGATFSMDSYRFKSQTIEVEATHDRDIRVNYDVSRMENNVRIKHKYRPDNELFGESNFYSIDRFEKSPYFSGDTRNRELTSTFSLQPNQSPYSLLGAARVNTLENSFGLSSIYTRSANANLSGHYRPSQYITLSAGGNVNMTETNSERKRDSTTTQSAIANYPLAAFDLDVYRYNSRVSGNLTNRTDRFGSMQSASLTPSQSLTRSLSFGGGKLGLRFDQSLQIGDSTRSKAFVRLIDSILAAWNKTQGGNSNSLSLSLRDSRSLNSTQDTYQSIMLTATSNEEISRDSRLNFNLSIQTTRQLNPTTPFGVVYTNSNATVQYMNQRAFNVRRLVFDSSLRAYSQAPMPVFAASPKEQGPVTWENSLTYSLGRLVTDFKLNLGREGDGTTHSLIAFSIKRYF